MEFFKPDYDLAEFSEKNKERNDKAYNAANKPLYYYLLAMTEELGEIAGALKKLERGFTPRDYIKMRKKLLTMDHELLHNLGVSVFRLEECETLSKMQELYPNSVHHLANMHYIQRKKELATEMADLFIYLDLAATNQGVNLWEEVKDKFNQVSEEMNFDLKI